MKRLRQVFGERVRDLRVAAGYKQDEFAEKCGFARSYMSRIETGVPILPLTLSKHWLQH